MRKFCFYLCLFSTVLLITCQKEISFDSGAPSEGSMLDDGSGNCLPKTVNGNYIAQASLTSSNTMQVTVNVTAVGSYNIFSDTVNNYYFKATGVFSTLGSHSVTLKGSGKPLVAGVDNFLIQYDSTACSVPITVLPAGTGNAVLTMDCANATVNGTYQAGTALTSANTVVLPVTVTTAGAYTISGSANGMTFSASGTVTTSTTSITLQGSNTPTTAQTTSVPVSFGSSSCSFSVTVTAGSGGGGGGGSGFNWQFNQGSTLYSGPVTGAPEASFGGNSTIAVNGASTAPSSDYLLLLQVSKPGNMSTGTFHSNALTNSVLFTLINTATSQATFSSTFGDGTDLVVNLTTYDPVGKICQGTFSGTAKNASGSTVNITSGTFRGQLQ